MVNINDIRCLKMEMKDVIDLSDIFITQSLLVKITQLILVLLLDCQNPNSTVVGFDAKLTLHSPTQPTTNNNNRHKLNLY